MAVVEKPENQQEADDMAPWLITDCGNFPLQVAFILRLSTSFLNET